MNTQSFATEKEGERKRERGKERETGDFKRGVRCGRQNQYRNALRILFDPPLTCSPWIIALVADFKRMPAPVLESSRRDDEKFRRVGIKASALRYYPPDSESRFSLRELGTNKSLRRYVHSIWPILHGDRYGIGRGHASILIFPDNIAKSTFWNRNSSIPSIWTFSIRQIEFGVYLERCIEISERILAYRVLSSLTFLAVKNMDVSTICESQSDSQ